MGTVRIFVASSAELKKDRDDFRNFLSVENDLRHEKGVYLELVQWEYFLDSVSQTSKQDDYNNMLKSCDIVICLFYKKAGKYTQLEFDTAIKQFNETGAPLIYTYFKEPDANSNPAPDTNNLAETDPVEIENRKNLESFKKRLEDLKHFYTRYTNFDNLQNQFGTQLKILQNSGFGKLQQDVRNERKEEVTNYINNVININTASVAGSNNVVIQGVTDSKITIINNGVSEEYKNDLSEIKNLLKTLALTTIQVDGRDINIDNVNDSNFGFLMGRVSKSKALPDELKENLITDSNKWMISLQLALKSKGISIKSSNNKIDGGSIFQHFGWLIEAYLYKINSPAGQKPTLRRLSFLAEAYQASLRFLCFVQLSQVLQLKKKPDTPPPAINEFIKLDKSQLTTYDYSNLLLITTDLLKGSEPFMTEIGEFVEELSDTGSDLYSTNLFLESNRYKLINKEIKEDEQLPELLDEYLTALVYWLRKLTFISQYKMVSIMDIKLEYRLGEIVHFEHVYGELNGAFGENSGDDDTLDNADADTMTASDTDVRTTKSIEGVYTFNQSILLLKDKNVDSGLDNIGDPDSYLSLSPLIIDQSVYSTKPKQTPEIYFYAGMDPMKRQYNYNYFRNELLVYENELVKSNKELNVKEINSNEPVLDPLYTQLDVLLKPFKIRNK